MTGNPRIVSIVDRSPKNQSRLKELGELLGFDGAPDRFLSEMLASQCRFAGAKGAVVLRPGEENRLELLAVYPPLRSGGTRTEWIETAKKVSRSVISSGETVIVPADAMPVPNGQSGQQLLVLPVQHGDAVRAATAFLVPAQGPLEMATCRERLEITPFLLNHYELNLTLNKNRRSNALFRLVLEVVAVVNRSDRLMSVAMALCNEIASRMNCNRVSIGILTGHHVRVQAVSHSDTFRREMQLIQDIEAAMEECLDQDLELIYPAAETSPCVGRATERLARNHGPNTVISLPIRQNGEVFAVLTLERPLEESFDTLKEIEPVRLTCDLVAPRLFEKHEQDRWFGARAAVSARRKLGVLIGPEHTWMKVGVVSVFLLALFLTLAKGNYRIDASFIFEAPVQQVVVAPFDTFIRSVAVEPGDEVEAGRNILGRLDTSELRLKLAALKAEQLGYRKKMTASMRDGKTVEAQIARAQIEKIAAQMALLDQNIEKAELVAPITGRLVSEDLKRQIGAPVKTGQVLFEIARIESLRAEIYVPEESIASVLVGQAGELASVGHPDQRIGFVVERINPIAEVVNSQNVFRVRARLDKQLDWMRPGMEGVAKIAVGKKPYIWLGTHRVTNWLRMKLWL